MRQTIIWITIAVYVAFILGVGIFSSRKSKSITDFTVGGRNAGAWSSILGGFFTALPPVVCKLFFPEVSLPVFGAIKDLGPHFACLAMVVSAVLCLTVSKITEGKQAINEVFYEKTAS